MYGNQNVVPMAPPQRNNYNPYAPANQQNNNYNSGYPPANQQYNPYNYQQNAQNQPQYNPNNPYIAGQQNQYNQPQSTQINLANPQQKNQIFNNNQQQQQYNNNQYVINNNFPKGNDQQQQQQQQQQLQQPAQISPQFIEHQKQLDQLKQRYPFQVVQPQFSSEIGKKTIVNIDLDIPNFKIPIKIELDSEFPKSKPIIYLRKRYLQQNVQDSTLKFLYDSNYRWDQNSTLLILITTTHQMLQSNPPYPDGLLEQIKEKKELIKEQQERQLFASIDAAKVFPGYQPYQYSELLKQQSYAQNIQSLPEVENLKKKVSDIAEFNVKITNDLIDQQTNLEVKKMNVATLGQEYEYLKQQLNQSISACNNIKERFGDMSIIQALGQKIAEIEDEVEKIKSGSFEDEILRYKNNRLQYHILNTQREKLTNSN